MTVKRAHPRDAVAGRDDSDPLLVFVHIPKTAGGTVITMLVAAYSQTGVRDAGNYLRNPERAKNAVSKTWKVGGQVLAGHVPYGLFRDPLPADTRYMTFLREPVERVLSHYYRHIHRQKQRSPARHQRRLEHPGKVKADLKTDSLEQAMVDMRLPHLNNLATRFLSGQASLFDDLPPTALDDAKQNLREFALIGIQERFEESLVLLQRMLGLGPVRYESRHVNTDRPSADEISNDDRALIEEHNALDAELYRFGLGLFEEAVASADEGFTTDVERLRAAGATNRPSQPQSAPREQQPAAEKAAPRARSAEDVSSAMDARGGDPLIAFVHIPKTAGKTVITMLVAAYTGDAVRDVGNYMRNPEKTALKVGEGGKPVKPWKIGRGSRPRRLGGGLRVEAGHVPYGVFREHLPPDTRYITFLREPVDRVVSQYWRHIRRQDPSRAGVVKKKAGARAKADSLQQALVEMRLPQINNLATRFLCGHPSPLDELPPSALEDAKANLRDFAFVGIQERFEESIVLLQRTLELGAFPYEDRHVSSDRPSVDEIPEEDRALIEEHNALDTELYRFGLKLFEEAVTAAGDGFVADVEALRAGSAAAREEDRRKAALAAS